MALELFSAVEKSFSRTAKEKENKKRTCKSVVHSVSFRLCVDVGRMYLTALEAGDSTVQCQCSSTDLQPNIIS